MFTEFYSSNNYRTFLCRRPALNLYGIWEILRDKIALNIPSSTIRAKILY